MKKLISLMLAISMLLTLHVSVMAESDQGGLREYHQSYGPAYQIFQLTYDGLDMEGLNLMNQYYGSDKIGDIGGSHGCSITFATYANGVTGAVRNMDLELSDYSAYELMIYPGPNVKYTTWALSYGARQAQSYQDIITNGLGDRLTAEIPFFASDAMSFGCDANGENASLYCALLIRSEELDDQGNYILISPGTCPGAPIRCCVSSVAALAATQCLSIDEALKYVGAVNEQYERIFPDDAPVLDVYSMNAATQHWTEACAMIDSTGRHGVLELVDNHLIWHEGLDYSFNYFLQDEYLYNPDGSYRETGGAGIGRYEATVPFLDRIQTVTDHVGLMDGVRYSCFSYYNEDTGYTGRAWNGDPVDWRSELTHADMWASYDNYTKQGLDTSAADARYPLHVTYLNTETNTREVVDSYEYWLANNDHLVAVYDLNFVMDDSNADEVWNCVRWDGTFFGSLTKAEAKAAGVIWETYFRVIADPMNFRVTRWFNEDVSTADSIYFADASPLNP